jgi:hypothetical protein
MLARHIQDGCFKIAADYVKIDQPETSGGETVCSTLEKCFHAGMSVVGHSRRFRDVGCRSA